VSLIGDPGAGHYVLAMPPLARARAGLDTSYLRLIGWGALIGAPAALLAAGFLALVHTVEDWLWDDLPDLLGQDSPPWYLVLALPVCGAGLVWAARRLLPGDGGHSPLLGIGGGVTPWQHVPGIALAALGTLAFGAVLGPEAPLIALGSAVGMVIVSLVSVDARGERVLATAGSFSAVSALFGGPLVAGILVLEAGIAAGAALVPVLLPGLVAAAVGYVLFVGLGDWGGLHETPLAVPGLPEYDGTHVAELLLAIVVGIVAAVVVLAVRRLAVQIDALARTHMTSVLFAGAVAVGTIAMCARLLGEDSQAVLFSGQASVPTEVAETSVGAVAVLLVAKALGYAVSLGCGFRGGPVFPAIFLGIAVAMFGVIWFDASPTWAVMVGSAAGMTAGTGLVFAALLFATLLVGTGGGDGVPATVFAATAAWLTRAAVRAIWPGATEPPEAVHAPDATEGPGAALPG
jgi:H+/Cl- antiporter ClcA